MAFPISPGVNVSEIDITAGVQNVSLSSAGFAGPFKWGPALTPITIASEQDLVSTFGKPDNNVFQYWFTAASYLTYSNQLKVVRAINANSFNATVSAKTGAPTATVTNGSTTVTLSANTASTALVPGRTVLIGAVERVIDTVTNATSFEVTSAFSANAAGETFSYYGTLVKNASDWDANYSNGVSGFGLASAKWAGELGNSLKVSVCPSTLAFSSSSVSGNIALVAGNTTVTGTSGTAFTTELIVGDYVLAGGQRIQVSAIANASSLTLASAPTANVASTSDWSREWEYAYLFDSAPGTSPFASDRNGSTDELHMVVVDEDGLFTGVPGTVLERFAFASKASDGRNANGENNYYATVLNRQSQYLWWLAHGTGTTTNWGSPAAGLTFGADALPLTASLIGGTDLNSTFLGGGTGALETAYDLFANVDDVDVTLLISGPSIVRTSSSNTDSSLATYIVGIAESRKDAVAFISPAANSVINQMGSEATLISADRGTIDSTYAFMDSGWKYTYDKYNDVYRWIPLNGDSAGVAARTATTNDPWYSPAGAVRGTIKNVAKLAWNPTKQADRDTLYKMGVNPVVAFPNEGVVLWGDKTLTTRPSAFDRVGVRFLFIALEKTISRYAKSQLFEFNDEFTRSSFRSAVEPFLRDVKARRGVTEYLLVCDASNNPAQIVDNNQFVGDIYVKPARSINFIQLNFVAVRSNVSFQEIVGGAA